MQTPIPPKQTKASNPFIMPYSQPMALRSKARLRAPSQPLPAKHHRASFTHPIAELRSHVRVSLLSTASLLNPPLSALYEHNATLTIPLSLPQSNATVGGRAAVNTVTVKFPFIESAYLPVGKSRASTLTVSSRVKILCPAGRVSGLMAGEMPFRV